MSFFWILLAFGLGFVARQFKLPPMVGYLAAGFVLHSAGYESDSSLEFMSELGITLMLFTIGLKVNFKELLRIDIWGTTGINMSSWILFLVPGLVFLSTILSAQILDLSLEATALVAFALSFSSTVCVIKILEDAAELKTRHGDLAISVLIIQDLVAVLFLFISTGKVPSIWSVSLIGLLAIRPLIPKFYKHIGHGELVPLSGIMLALGGAALFEAVGLKGDLGALAIGMLVAGMPFTSELYKSLISLKDLFLIGFFLSIGFTAIPTLDMWLVAASFLLVLPVKFALFFWVITRFNFRARTAFLSAILLTNFSEFGLIVASLAEGFGWLSKEWLVIIALATAMSFVISSFAYQFAHRQFAKRKDSLLKFQKSEADSAAGTYPQDIEVLIVGMGRVGIGAYHELIHDGVPHVWGIEVEASRVEAMKAQGLKVFRGDADDIEFWESIDLSRLKLVMLALPSTTEMINILDQLEAAGYRGRTSAIARYEDEQQKLKALGADVAFNYYSEVGTGFAEESKHLLTGFEHEAPRLEVEKVKGR